MYFWTDAQIAFLKENYDKIATAEIAAAVGRTHLAVWKKLQDMGMQLPDKIKFLNKSLARRGEKSTQWKGGKYITKKGYVYVTVAPGKRKFEHVIVMEKFIGRTLRADECVHHIDENKQNNDL